MWCSNWKPARLQIAYDSIVTEVENAFYFALSSGHGRASYRAPF